MKLYPILAASLFALMAAISLNASAATDAPADAKNAADTAAAENAAGTAAVKAENAAHQMKMRPHSHVEEKTGFVQRAPEAAPDRPNPARDFSKHFHPRDGK